MTTPNYDLHSLGWSAFQQLCGTILREVWGQTFQTFGESNDAGRDGAFYGTWASRGKMTFSGSTTVQCKFSNRPEKSIAPHDLDEEFSKARRLAKSGFAKNYLLITNCKISGRMEAEIGKRFREVAGIQHFACYAREWICSIISENKHLRMLVPRLYGLGDLTQILDERAYSQAKDILSSLDDELGKFVITKAHRDSVEALNNHRFVLLLGEPACGKSTIASALALGAADQWNSQLIKLESPEQFRDHWNPHEPRQFFWVDDAFGQTQYERPRALSWNYAFPALIAAIKQGAALVFTSRDYIYRAALNDLKEEAFPLLREGRVVIEVQQLSLAEKEQILYNHIKLGNQTKEFRSDIKQFLPELARSNHFLPEIARRLGNSFFTKNIALNHDSVLHFVQEPQELLCDITKRLDLPSRAALGMVFMRGGKLPSVNNLDAKETKALALLNSNLGEVRIALKSLKGTLVVQTHEQGEYFWRFKHPTIRDAFGALVSEEPDLIDIYLAGTKLTSVLTEITCGEMTLAGVKLIVPQDSWSKVIARLDELDLDEDDQADILYDFLANRCHSDFLKIYIEGHPDFISSLQYGSWMRYHSAVSVATRLYECELLPEEERERFVERAGILAIETPDADFLDVARIKALFFPSEIDEILRTIISELGPKLRSKIASLRRDCVRDGGDPEQDFWTIRRAIRIFRSNLPKDWNVQRRFRRASEQIDQNVASLTKKRKKLKALATETPIEGGNKAPTRSIFDGVDEF